MQLQTALWSNSHFVAREVSFLRSNTKTKVSVERLAEQRIASLSFNL